VIRLLLSRVIGSCCIIGGVLLGLSTHQVAYRHSGSTIVAHFLSGGSTSSKRIGYLQMVDDDTLYLINEDDFSPPVQDTSFGDGDRLSFIYLPVDTTSINVGGTNTSTHLQGQAYSIEQFTVLPSASRNGVAPVTYTSAAYRNNPAGYAQRNWLFGGGLLGLGLLVSTVGFMLHKLRGRKQQHWGSAVTPSGTTAPFRRR